MTPPIGLLGRRIVRKLSETGSVLTLKLAVAILPETRSIAVHLYVPDRSVVVLRLKEIVPEFEAGKALPTEIDTGPSSEI